MTSTVNVGVTPRVEETEAKESLAVKPKPSAQLETEAHGMVRKLQAMMGEAAAKFRRMDDFSPTTPGDTIIVSWAKSGTTLMQNMVYQLKVLDGQVPTDRRGDDFLDISYVVPFIEYAPISGVFEPAHRYRPTAWKTHATVDQFVKPASNLAKFRDARFLYLLRDGRDCARSFLDFVNRVIVSPGQEWNTDKMYAFYVRYFETVFLESKTWFHHVRDWLNDTDYKTLPNILFVCYEHLTQHPNELQTWVRIIARFIGIPEHRITDDIVQEVIDRCDRDRMASDKRFTNVKNNAHSNKVATRVRPTSEKRHGFAQYNLPKHCTDKYDRVFRETLGLDGYHALEQEVRKRNKALLQSYGYCDESGDASG